MLRATKLRYYVNYMEEQGFAASTVLIGSGISVEQLREDPSLVIDQKQSEIVINNMIRHTGDPALGFKVGGNIQLADFGILAYAMMSSKTLRDAQFMGIQYQSLFGLTVKMAIEESDESWTTYFDPALLTGSVRQFCIEEIMMCYIKVGEELTGKLYVPSSCSIGYPAPPYAEQYSRLLRCPVRFDAPRTSLVMTQPRRDTKLRGYDPEFNEVCQHQCRQLMRQLSDFGDARLRVLNLFQHPAHDIPTLEEAAKKLGIGARTLRRQLEKEGTSYYALLDQFRMDLAKENLRLDRLTPKEIGYIVGFKNVPAFRRAFKRWTGKTVRQFREDTKRHS